MRFQGWRLTRFAVPRKHPAMNRNFTLLLVITALVLSAGADEESRSSYQQTYTK